MTKPVIDASRLLGFRLIGQASGATLAEKVGAKIGDKTGTKEIGSAALSGARPGPAQDAEAMSRPALG
jgi:hypothetical protein